MIRSFLLVVVFFSLFSAALRAPMAAADEVIPQRMASTHGLLRAWSLQVDLDRSRSRVQSVVLNRGVVFVQSDAAVVHAFDAESGRPIWSGARVVGEPRYPTLPPAVSKNLLGVVNGSNLYVLNRHNGNMLWKTEIEGVPAMTPCMNDQLLLVPTINGLVFMYRLKPVAEDEAATRLLPKAKPSAARAETEPGGPILRLAERQPPPLACESPGQLTGPPVMLSSNDDEDLVGWTTDRGALLIGAIEHGGARFAVRHRFLAGSGTAAGLAFRPAEGSGAADTGLVYVASREGLVYAVSEKTGQSVWEFPVGDAVAEPPALIGSNVYVVTQLGGMFCLDAKSGALRWTAPYVAGLLAAGTERFYGVDKLERLVTLDIRTGSRLDQMDIHAFPLRVANSQSDRIYLATRRGLVQCLRDPRQAQALVHSVEPKRSDKKVEKEKASPRKPAETAKAPAEAGGFMGAKAEPKAAAGGGFGFAVEEKPEPKKTKKATDAAPMAPADPFAKPAKK